MTAIDTTALSKRYATTVAVDAVSLRLAAGEVRGLLGPNGAGKTTLLRMLFGLVAPDTGTIALLGRPIDPRGGDALDGVGGFVEDPAFYPYLSARANLALLARLDGTATDGTAIDAALAELGLAQRAEDRVAGFSTGMKQRLGIAAALIRRPRLLLLDEPTSGLDPGGARTVAALVRRLAADGVAVLLSSHQIGELERVCDSYTVMRHGAVVWDGSARALEDQAPASAYTLATGDDARALAIAAATPGVRAEIAPGTAGDALAIAARPDDLAALVFALSDARIPVRRLELIVSPLESMFFALTGEARSDELETLAPRELAEAVLAGSGR